MADEADWQMVRGTADGFNLSIGENVLLQQSIPVPEVRWDGPMCYPSITGHDELIEVLSKFYPDHHIVIAHGAKQALSAAFYAISKSTGIKVLHMKPPYWPSFPTLMALQGKIFSKYTSSPFSLPCISCVASPNNPDGTEVTRDLDIHDAVYAHNIYGYNPEAKPNAKITIYSAAKMLGVSGARIGWAITKDQNLANLMAKYVEFTTSGVSLIAQKLVTIMLHKYRNGDYNPAMGKVQHQLKMNGEMIEGYLSQHCFEMCGVPDTNKGMFAFFKVKDTEKFQNAIEQAKISLVTGEACGMIEPGWFRMNCAQDRDHTDQALQECLKYM